MSGGLDGKELEQRLDIEDVDAEAEQRAREAELAAKKEEARKRKAAKKKRREERRRRVLTYIKDILRNVSVFNVV